MAKIQRKTQKIFAGNATSDQITAFGTAKNTSPTYTRDIAQIQSNVYLQGWTPSLMSDLAPYLQDSNALWFLVTTQLAYLYQQGIAEWDAGTEYAQGSLVSDYNNGELAIYMSKVNNNINHTRTDNNYWKKYLFKDYGELNNPFSLFDCKYSDHILENTSWLRSQGQWNARSVYTSAYDLLLQIYNGQKTITGISVKSSTSSYTDYDFVINTSNTTFRLPIKTKLASGSGIHGNGMTLGLTDGVNNSGFWTSANGTSMNNSSAYGTSVGSGVTIATQTLNNNKIGITTDSSKSGIETDSTDLYLYYYVGETVQNQALIDIGQVLSILANKVDIADKEWAISACMPDWNRKISKSNNILYTAETNGWINALGGTGQAGVGLQINGYWVGYTEALGGSDSSAFACLVPISAGENYQAFGCSIIQFMPCKGVS